MFINPELTEKMLSFLENEHLRYRRSEDAAPSQDEVDFSSFSIVLPSDTESPLQSRMVSDLTKFLGRCMDCRQADGGKRLRFVITPGATDPKDERFRINVTADGAEITAPGERGLLHASHHIEKTMALRGGPFMQVGAIEKEPLFNPRISQTTFTAGDGSILHPYMLTDDYLSLMSHFGINGIHIYMRIWDYCRNTALPELSSPEAEKNLQCLSELCKRASVHGIDIYCVVRNEYFVEDHPVYINHPDCKGAPINYILPNARYNLCSSSPKVRECYRQTLQHIFRTVPELGGILILVGGEGFIHCFTRPKPPLNGGTSCRNCAGKSAAHEVASLVDHLADSAHEVSPDALVLAWPYSAFTWSGEADPNQEEWLRLLNPGVQVLSNFDNPSECVIDGASALLIDYNIRDLGPSDQFAAQTDILRDYGKGHYAKFENTIEPGWFFLPYLPIHYRWTERVRRLRSQGVPGYVAQWRFYGLTGSIADEILSEMSWTGSSDDDSLLASIAQRDFGTASSELLDGWRTLSEAWGEIPASHMLFGERQYYMKGPYYLGPAHPMIFNPQNRYELGRGFFTVRGDDAEYLTAEELAIAEQNAPPRYSCDLLFAYPFGVDALDKALCKTIDMWDKGVSLISSALGDDPTPRASMELGICRIIGIHLKSTLNTLRFYSTRDRFYQSQGSEAVLTETFDRMHQILNDEIANAQVALPIVENDFRIGYGHTYGQVYDAAMIRDKIRQCEFVRDEELPELKSGILFHVYGKYVV